MSADHAHRTLSRLLLPLMLFAALVTTSVYAETTTNTTKTLAYLVSDNRIPFWNILNRGIQSQAESLGYQVHTLSANNQAKQELQNTLEAIREGVSGIIVSPTNSSACVTILEFANQAKIPVVIADIGTEKGDYVSYISSNNYQGAYQIGQVLTQKMHALNWQDGSVGIIAIPQARQNGKERTEGFLKALAEAKIKGAGIRQQVTFSYQETYDFSKELIQQNPELKALWLQGSDRYQGALDAIHDTGKDKQILLLTFDAEPVFLELIPNQVLVGAAMQQPFLMGVTAVTALDDFLQGKKVSPHIKLSVLAVSESNIEQLMPLIRKNVLGLNE